MRLMIAGAMLGALVLATTSSAQTPGGGHAHGGGAAAGHAQPYAGQQSREVTSLSDEDVAALRDGRGMGLARPAEINGYPGPMHVLELADRLELTDEQRRLVQASFDRMKARARAAGAAYVEAEKAVDAALRSAGAARETVAALVRQADIRRAEKRLAHIEAHLEITPLLTAEQRRRYAELRGYR